MSDRLPTVEYDPERRIFYVDHEWNAPLSMSAVVLGLVEMLPEPDPPDGVALYDSIDPDALNGAFSPTSRSRRSGGRLWFQLWRYTIWVEADGQIVVFPPDRTPWPVPAPES